MPEIYKKIAMLLNARENCIINNNQEGLKNHTDSIESIVKNHLPSGSGFDAGTTIDLNRSKENKIVFNTAFHHMDENGYYKNWTYHSVIVTPSLAFNFNLVVTGRDKNAIKSYISDQFIYCLETILP